MSGKLQAGDKAPGDKAAEAAPEGKATRRDFDAVQLAKAKTFELDAALKAKNANPASLEFRAGNALNTARDVGYASAVMDVYACRPDAEGFGSAQEALDAWAAAIGELVPQWPS